MKTTRSRRWTRLMGLMCCGLSLAAGAAFAGTPPVATNDGSSIGIDLVPRIKVVGLPGLIYSVQYVDNLNQTNWQTLTNILLPTTSCTFIDDTVPAGSRRFYRVSQPTFSDTNFVWIAPGMFTMGSSITELDRSQDENPVTHVTITRGFWMSKHEVTQAEYVAVIGINPSDAKGDLQRPVEHVSWIDATNYCAKLTARERSEGRLPANYEYRLPTEAEWEYASRAGTTSRFYWGDDTSYSLVQNYAWYKGNSALTTHPVELKQPNQWGLYDMSGNVWEWCLDWYGTYSGGNLTDPTGPTSGTYRVFRGGGWSNTGASLRSATRGSYLPDSQMTDVGFRPVVAPVRP